MLISCFLFAADAVDSRLEFPEPIKVGNETEFAYTLLLGKPFPALGRFTMSVFLKPDSVERRQAVFSYKYISQGKHTVVLGEHT